MSKKKVIAILIIVLTIVLIIVGTIAIIIRGNSSKEKLLEKANELNLEEAKEDLYANYSTAKDKYINNVYKVEATIHRIDEKFVELIVYQKHESVEGETSGYASGDVIIKAKLDKEDTNKIVVGQKITILGKINEVDKNWTYDLIMKKAYLLDDYCEYEGKITIPTKIYYQGTYGSSRIETKYHNDDEWYARIGNYKIDSQEFDKKSFSKTESVSDQNEPSVLKGKEVKYGDVVKIRGKLIFNTFRDVEIVE